MSASSPGSPARRGLPPAAWAVLAICLAAVLPYLSTLHNYFVQDDFGVVQLLAKKPAGYFPRWFTTTWMDDIWGFIPDEIRPFPAVTYQLTALWGAGSPVANHVLNIALHAANGLLVLAVARMMAGLGLASATFAALAFVLLPNQAESVAWITGRVDTIPALFYVATVLLYARWVRDRTIGLYAGALVLFFIALFSKQNTITLVPALIAYDLLVARRLPRLSLFGLFTWTLPYLPFAALTIGYLALRYVVFGEVARESQLNAQNLTFFEQLVERHFRRLVFGSVTLGTAAHWAGAFAAAIGVWLVSRTSGSSTTEAETSRTSTRPTHLGSALFFGPVWLFLGIAPTIVANYESPRHIYLASLGWAILLGLAFEALWHARPARVWRTAATIAAAALLIGYTLQLRGAVAHWSVAAAVSQRAVIDLEREARALPAGRLVIAGAPVSSWEWAIPFAAQPPFAQTDVSAHVAIISPMRLHCCRGWWHDYTRRTLQAWLARPDRTPVVALYWEARTGRLSRLTDRDEPFLRQMMPLLLDTPTPEALDTRLVDMLDRLVAGR